MASVWVSVDRTQHALSNFVADAVNVVGFDPFAKFVDYIEERAGFVAAGASR